MNLEDKIIESINAILPNVKGEIIFSGTNVMKENDIYYTEDAIYDDKPITFCLNVTRALDTGLLEYKFKENNNENS